MKKLIALLLAAVMCLSLAACGNGKTEDNSGTSQRQPTDNLTQEQTVEITLDNWQEYFEIKEYLGSGIITNDFGEPTKYSYSVYTLFAVKEELAENVVSCDVAIEYDADSSPKNISFNAKDMTFEITGDCENENIPDDYRDSSRFTRGATA